MIKLLPYLVVLVPIVITLLIIIFTGLYANARTKSAESLSIQSPPDSNQKEKGFESEEPINPKSRKIRWE